MADPAITQPPPGTAEPAGPLSRLLVKMGLQGSLRALSADERRKLTAGQVEATRPVISGVLISGALVLALTGVFEAVGLAPSIGYQWWLTELVALTVAGLAVAVALITDWRPRLALVLLSTVLLGVFISIPVPGDSGQLAIRTGLFQLLPIALLALLIRPASVLSMIVTMLGLAWVRIALHGEPATGAALYWLSTTVAIGFGLLLGAYRSAFAMEAFRIRTRLREQATTDDLTGLLNRAGWNRHAVEAHAAAVSRGAPLSVVFFDIDNFKLVNDRYGHAVGDAVLQKLGEILKQRGGGDSFCARMGGEEFVVLFVDSAPEAVEGFARRVRMAFEAAAVEEGVTVSAGVAHRQVAESMGQHLRRADRALYQAKTLGRDRMVVAAG